MKPLLNYSTTIEASKTVGEIQSVLAEHGARKVMMEYDDGIIEALSFTVVTPQGEVPIRLPVRPDAVLKIMQSNPRSKGKATREQAVRVAWRILKDWILAQMAFLQTEMVTVEEIFLSWMVTANGQTVFDRMVEDRFLLEEG